MEETISFEDLGLDEASLAAVEAKGFTAPSPIQVLAIPRLLNGDANVIAKARTGTGKTAAFGIPLTQTIREERGYVRALVLTPTRELALQVSKEIESLTTGKYPRLAAVYGGQSMFEQLRRLKSGVEIVVGTPGRVQDHLERGSLKIDKIDYFILDEADEMLDMGFIEDIEAIFAEANPQSRVLLFSATMPSAILKIASKFMGDYEIVEEAARPEEPVLTEQYYWTVRESEKINALVRLIDVSDDFYGLVFTQTKADADTVAKELDERGYEAAALHGDIAQSQREKILGRFRAKKTRILVATDVAARGIDIEGLTHVVNYAMPFDGPTYIHRIGRTGRAGAKGLAFTLVRPEERRKVSYLRGVSGGNLKEGKVPSVEEVLKIKQARLFSDLQRTLGLVKSSDEESERDTVREPKTDAPTGNGGIACTEKSANVTANMPATETASANTDGGDMVSAATEAVTASVIENVVQTAAISTADSVTTGAAVSCGNTDAVTASAAAFDAADSEAETVPAAASETTSAPVPETASAAATLTDSAPMSTNETPRVKKASKRFISFASALCQDNDPVSVLAAVLEDNFGTQLNPARYGTVTQCAQNNGGMQGKGARQIRLYVGLGRRDGMGCPEVARFFSDLLHIPGRLVDRISITENFSLVSLPPDCAMRALDMAKSGKRLPHMHIDVKAQENTAFERRPSRAGERGARSGGYKGGVPFNKRRGGDEQGGFKRKSGFKRDLMPLQTRTSNASLYKKN